MPSNHHVQKPAFMNQISLGNILSAIAIMGAGLGVWVTLNIQLARAETAVVALDQKFSSSVEAIERRQDRSEQRIEKQLEQVNAKLDRLIEQR